MTDGFVLDVSATVPWALPEQISGGSQAAKTALERGATAFVPPLWKYELANTLLVSERRRRLPEGEAERFMEDLADMDIEENDEWPSALSLVAHGRIHALSGYDAAYLTLAKRLAVPLATNDEALRRAAELSDIELL
jgi:predicted nucleic acid-binding protein